LKTRQTKTTKNKLEKLEKVIELDQKPVAMTGGFPYKTMPLNQTYSQNVARTKGY
jgi:hypothetical protein